MQNGIPSTTLHSGPERAALLRELASQADAVYTTNVHDAAEIGSGNPGSVHALFYRGMLPSEATLARNLKGRGVDVTTSDKVDHTQVSLFVKDGKPFSAILGSLRDPNTFAVYNRGEASGDFLPNMLEAFRADHAAAQPKPAAERYTIILLGAHRGA